MKTQTFIRICSLAMLLGIGTAQAGVVVIGHPGLGKIDAETVKRIYKKDGYVLTGGVRVRAVNLTSDDPARAHFLRTYLNWDDERYIGFWNTVTANALGTPPSELAGSAAVIKFVEETPGGIGYIDESDLQPGLNIISSPSSDFGT